MISALVLPGAAQALPASQAGNPEFQNVWARADYPVATGKAKRSWLWGPQPIATRVEPLAGRSSAEREVVYFDKARMEINDPGADPSSPWYVSNGLLVFEMISGRMQVGADTYEQRAPADIVVAGDTAAGPDSSRVTPTYASLARVASTAPGQNQATSRVGRAVTDVLLADGSVSPAAPQGIGAVPKLQYFEPTTGHNIPDVFWAHMNQRGTVYQGGRFSEDLLFNWVYVTGYPVTEPYWLEIRINNKKSWVMAQAFQRRLLTYNPGNAPEWRVEMGNAGLQYYEWRYGSRPPAQPTQVPNGVALNTRPITPSDSSRSYSGINAASYSVVKSQQDWEALWKAHTASVDPRPATPAVDFQKEFVVATFWGDKPSSGYTVDIVSAVANRDTITVTVRQKSPPPGAPVLTVVTQPYDMVAVTRTGLAAGKYRVVFVDEQGGTLGQAELSLP
jgi:hypothetical protein